MPNIVWNRPDGGVSVTTFHQEALEAMAWAREHLTLLDSEARDVARLSEIKAEIDLQKKALDAAESAAVRDEILLSMRSLGIEAAQIKVTLDDIATVKHIRDEIGLDEAEHAALILARTAQDTEDFLTSGQDAKKRPPYLGFQYAGKDLTIPADETFRGAWVLRDGAIAHDMPKALVIAQDAIRATRAPKLAALDVDFMRAVEAGDSAKQAQVAAQKQRLRDATADARLTGAQTPEALKAAMQAVIDGL